jgi:hypothetical protein
MEQSNGTKIAKSTKQGPTNYRGVEVKHELI